MISYILNSPLHDGKSVETVLTAYWARYHNTAGHSVNMLIGHCLTQLLAHCVVIIPHLLGG